MDANAPGKIVIALNILNRDRWQISLKARQKVKEIAVEYVFYIENTSILK